MNIYILSFFDEITNVQNIYPTINHIFSNSNFTIVNNYYECDVCFILFQNTSSECRGRIFNCIEKTDENIKNNKIFFTTIKNMMTNSRDKKFIIYTRIDESTLPDDYTHYFLGIPNFKLLVKEYVTDFFNNQDFLIESRKLLKPSIESYFNFKNGEPTPENKWCPFYKNFDKNYILNTKKEIDECYKNKIYLFNFISRQYSFWYLDKDNKKTLIYFGKNNDISPRKIYNVFFCKHQRSSVDGIARRYLLDIIMPKIKEEIPETIFFESLPLNEYHSYLEQSKIVISPYGMGERIDDDPRAPLYETIVIKPLCDSVYDYTNLFTNKKFNKYHKVQFTQHIVFCKPDYSDLLEVINEVLSNYDFYIERVRKYKKECEEYIKTDKFRTDFLETLNEALNV